MILIFCLFYLNIQHSHIFFFFPWKTTSFPRCSCLTQSHVCCVANLCCHSLLAQCTLSQSFCIFKCSTLHDLLLDGPIEALPKLPGKMTGNSPQNISPFHNVFIIIHYCCYSLLHLLISCICSPKETVCM